MCSAKNFDLVKSLGADAVIDYTKEDFTTQNNTYDMVYDAVMKSSKKKCKKVLGKNGIYTDNYWLASIKEEDFLQLKQLIQENIIKPVIDTVYPLDNVVEAHRYIDTERKRGNVVLTVNQFNN